MGGATVAGTYTKIDKPLDEKQINKILFAKVLRLQNVGFHVTSIKKGIKEEVMIYPFGLSWVNQRVKINIDGMVTGAETEDLNSDGFPEIVVFTHMGENKMGNVVGCSLNNEKTMSFFYFQPTANNAQINKDYNCFD